MSKWEELGAPDPVVMALRDLNFSEPTAIQTSSIPPALVESKDIIGAAETVCVCSELLTSDPPPPPHVSEFALSRCCMLTCVVVHSLLTFFLKELLHLSPLYCQGSGKTLAYGIPILTKILSVLKEKTETTSTKRKRVKKRAKERSEGEGIIDLNRVLHSPEERVAGAGSGQQEVSKAVGNHDDDEMSDDVMDKAVGTCVHVRDHIPDDEFERLLGGVDTMAADVAKGDGVKELEESGGLLSLVVVPTRELAFQVQDHLEKAAKYTHIKVGWDQLQIFKHPTNWVWKWVCCCIT